MKAAFVAALLLLAACSPGAAPGEPDSRIDCRPAGAAHYERACTVEAADGAAGRVLTIRKADGGFRRLLVARDGRGVVAADGAEAARVTLVRGDRIEVEIGGDRFRLPATLR